MNDQLITPAQQLLGRVSAAKADGQSFYELIYAPENKIEWDEWNYQAKKAWQEGVVSGAGFNVSKWRQTPDPTDNPRAVAIAVVWDQEGREAAIEVGYEF